jgi:hypothetical protein
MAIVMATMGLLAISVRLTLRTRPPRPVAISTAPVQ